MNDNGNIRLLTPENDIRVRVFLSSLEDLLEKVEKYVVPTNRRWTGNAITLTRNWPLN